MYPTAFTAAFRRPEPTPLRPRYPLLIQYESPPDCDIEFRSLHDRQALQREEGSDTGRDNSAAADGPYDRTNILRNVEVRGQATCPIFEIAGAAWVAERLAPLLRRRL